MDGGTDRWLDYLGEKAKDLLSGKSKEFVPTMVTGDMDSISKDTFQKLKALDVQFIETANQDETDYTKALREVGKYSRMKNIKVNISALD